MSDDHSQLRALIEQALDLSEPGDREALLAGCADPALAAAARELLGLQTRAALLDLGAARLAQLPADVPVPARIGPYRIIGLLGRGGMGDVYHGVRDDGSFEMQVAVKVVRDLHSAEQIARFERERALLARLEHPAIARVLDGGCTESGAPWMAIERVVGQPLDQHVAARSLSIRERLQLLQAVIDAVQYAHQNLIVHRDLKPANILVQADGRPKLLDFGVAKLLGEADHTQTAGRAPMTFAYASPEQIRGDPITTATDVYALGVVLYEVLTGERPHRAKGEDALTLLQAIAETDATAPSECVRRRGSDTRTVSNINPHQLKGDLDTIVLKALNRDPARRYPSAQSLREDLDRYLTNRPIHARPVSWPDRALKWIRRNRLAAAMIGLAAAAIVSGTAGAGWMALKAAREAESARAAQGFLQSVFISAMPERNGGSMPTALDLADNAFERLDRDLADQPLARADLYRSLAGMYNYAGDSRRVLQSAERSLALLLEYDPQSERIPAVRTVYAYGLVYADRVDEAREQMRHACVDAEANAAQQAQCTLFNYGFARTLGDPDAALRVLLQAQPLYVLGADPYRHAARHARTVRHYATAWRFLTLAAERPRKAPMGRAEAAFLLSTALPLLAAAGGRDQALTQAGHVAAEQPVIWLGGNHVSDFAVDRVRMFQLLGMHGEALAAARGIERVDPVRRLDVEPLLTRAMVELNDGDRQLAGEFFEAVRATLEGRTGSVDPRLWLARAGLACLRELAGDAGGTQAQQALLEAVVSPDFEEYASLARAPCPTLSTSAAAQQSPAEAPPPLDALWTLLTREVLPNIGRCADGHVVEPGARCAAAVVPANLR